LASWRSGRIHRRAAACGIRGRAELAGPWWVGRSDRCARGRMGHSRRGAEPTAGEPWRVGGLAREALSNRRWRPAAAGGSDMSGAMKRTRGSRLGGRRSVTGACGQLPDGSSMRACRAVAPDRNPRHGSSRRGCTESERAGVQAGSRVQRQRLGGGRRDGSSERPAAAGSAGCASQARLESPRCHGQNQGARVAGLGVARRSSGIRKVQGWARSRAFRRQGADLADDSWRANGWWPSTTGH